MPRKTKEGYPYDLLSREAKETALDWWRSLAKDIESQMITESFEVALEEAGLPKEKVYWILQSSQGDGVSFYGSLDIEDYLRKNKLYMRFKALIPYVLVKIGGESTRFHGPGSMDVEMELDGTWQDLYYKRFKSDPEELPGRGVLEWLPGDRTEKIKAEWAAIEVLSKEFKELLKENVDDMAKKLIREGEAELEYQDSEEYIKDVFAANDYRFDEAGNLI